MNPSTASPKSKESREIGMMRAIKARIGITALVAALSLAAPVQAQGTMKRGKMEK
jgi:hypothetical protein